MTEMLIKYEKGIKESESALKNYTCMSVTSHRPLNLRTGNSSPRREEVESMFFHPIGREITSTVSY